MIAFQGLRSQSGVCWRMERTPQHASFVCCDTPLLRSLSSYRRSGKGCEKFDVIYENEKLRQT